MPHHPWPLVFLLATIAAATSVAAQEVGALGVVTGIEVVGNQNVTTADLRRALLGDLSYLVVSHPRAPLDGLLAALPGRIVAGYQLFGFPRVTAEVEVAGDHLRLRIVEGPRVMYGAIAINGAKVLPVGEIVTWLTTRHPTAEAEFAAAASIGEKTIAQDTDPFWRPGHPADVRQAYLKDLAAQVVGCYSHAGRLGVAVKAVMVAGEAGTADLRITVESEGVVARLAEVVFNGLARNPRGEVERLLGIVPDMAIGPDAPVRMEGRLRASGRFRTQEVKLEPTADPLRFRLKVTVLESGNIPPLPLPFTPAAEALLACRSWLLADLAGGEDDLVLAISKGQMSFELVLSPRHGLLFSYDVTPADGHRRRGGMLFADDEYRVASGAQGRGVHGTTESGLRLIVGFSAATGEDRDQRTANRDRVALNAQLAYSRKEEGRSAFVPELTIDPAALLTQAYGDDQHWRLEAGRLILGEKGAATAAIDVAIGRFEMIDVSDAVMGSHLRAGFTPNAFSARRDAFLAWSRELAWREEPETPFSSVMSLVRIEALELLPLLAPGDAEAMGSRQKLMDVLAYVGPVVVDHLLPRAERWMREHFAATFPTHGKGDDVFGIPYPDDLQLSATTFWAPIVAKITSWLAEDLPNDGWPMVVLRGVSGVLAGAPRYLNDDLRRLTAADGCGPLGCFAVSWIAGMFNPPLSRLFAQLGRERLGTDHLLRDIRLFRAYAPALVPMGGALPAEAGLLTLFPEAHRPALGDLRTTLRQMPADATGRMELYEHACSVLWEHGLRDVCRQYLEAISKGPSIDP